MISFVEVFLLAAIFGVLYAMLQLASRWPDSDDAVERPAGDGGWAERVMLASHVRTCDSCSPPIEEVVSTWTVIRAAISVSQTRNITGFWFDGVLDLC